MEDIVRQSFAMTRLNPEDPNDQIGMPRNDHGLGHDQRGIDGVDNLSLLEHRIAG